MIVSEAISVKEERMMTGTPELTLGLGHQENRAIGARKGQDDGTDI